MRKRTLFTFLIIALVLCFPLTVSAHPGGTDSKGGHTDHSTGQYHYHCGGNPAHQHIGGVCPYKTNSSGNSGSSGSGASTSGSYSGGTSSGNSHTGSSSRSSGPSVGTVIGIVLGPVIACGIWWFVAWKKESQFWQKWALLSLVLTVIGGLIGLVIALL